MPIVSKEAITDHLRVRAENERLRAEIERLRAEVQTWINHTKTAVWSDSEECKFLTAENDRLRAALASIDGAIRKWDTAMVDENGVVHHDGIGNIIADDIQKLVAAAVEAPQGRMAQPAENKPANRRRRPEGRMAKPMGVKEALSSLIEEDGKLIFEAPKASAAENTDDR